MSGFFWRVFLAAASFGVFAWASVAHAEVSQPTYPKSDLLLVTTVINATNPYMASWIQGSKDLAAKLGVPLEVVQSNGSSQTEMAGIQAQAAKGKKIVLVMNPVAASNVPAVVKTITANGGYMVVWWNMPPGTEPKTSGDHFVAFGTYNGITAGEWRRAPRSGASRKGKHHCFARRARQHGEPGALPGLLNISRRTRT